MSKEYKFTAEQVKAMESKAAKVDRFEVIPCKEGFKIVAIQRKELKTE